MSFSDGFEMSSEEEAELRALGAFEPVPKVLDDALAFFTGWSGDCEQINAPVPSTLFHYTDVRGLLGILRSKSLWATNVSFLNDHTEIIHSLTAARRFVVDEIGPDGSASGAQQAMLWVIDNLPLYLDVFVTCFCTQGDLLSQWRGYGRHEGYSVGFPSESLAAITGGRLDLVNVVYDETKQQEWLLKLIKGWSTTLEDLPAREDDHPTWKTATLLFAEALSLLAVRFKNSSFEEEGEWRLVYRRSEVIPDDGLNLGEEFREGVGVVVPYVPIPVVASDHPLLPISNVLVGPSRYPVHAAFAIERFVRSLGYPDGTPKVDLSTVPLREW